MHLDILFNETLTILNVIDGAPETVLYNGMRNLNFKVQCTAHNNGMGHVQLTSLNNCKSFFTKKRRLRNKTDVVIIYWVFFQKFSVVK